MCPMLVWASGVTAHVHTCTLHPSLSSSRSLSCGPDCVPVRCQGYVVTALSTAAGTVREREGGWVGACVRACVKGRVREREGGWVGA